MKKIYNIFVLVFAFSLIASLQSCLKDDTEVFEKNSANRMSDYLDNAKSVITSGNATWLMEMYPESSQSYGGWAFTLKFSGDSVTVQSENETDRSKQVTSLWKVTNDDGPVLSFDTYNDILHYFSTPSSGAYQAFKGEFEWIITDVQQDQIKLRGKKTGNTIYMYRMTEEPTAYLNSLSTIDDAMIFTGLSYVSGNDTIAGVIDTDYRQIEFTATNRDTTETVDIAYEVTPKGIKLYKDIELLGKTYRDFTLNFNAAGDAESMTAANGDNFVATFPEGWLSYDKYAGDYTLKYYPASDGTYNTVDVSLVPAGDGVTYYLTGLNPNYDVVAKYKKSTGTLQICSQIVLDSKTHESYLSSTGYYIACISWAAAFGYISYSTSVGMEIKWNGSEEGNMQFNISDNGTWGSYKVSSYYFYYFKAATLSSSNRVGKVTNTAEYIQGTYKSYQFPYLNALVKK